MASSQHHPGKRSLLLLLIYGLALLHVGIAFTIGEPYPSLQGPLFAGHLHQGEMIHVPFVREAPNTPRLPDHDKILRSETLGTPIQRDFATLAPTLSGHAAKEFLIGHSIRSPFLQESEASLKANWSTWKFQAPPSQPPKLLGEEDIIND